MNKYNPDIHHRRSIRLRNYDYAQQGLYFVTLCVKNRICLFGEIVNGKMQLNENGKIVHNEWLKTAALRPNVRLHAFVVMPNHFHTVFEITHKIDASVRAYCIRPDEIHPDETVGNQTVDNRGVDNQGVCNTPLRSPSQTVGAIIRGFKSAVSRQLGFSVWQRDMYEHIIRDANNYGRIIEYIENNPAVWKTDMFCK